ncbi:MAG: RNA polymerase sigma factor [Planctomycetota bacterium]|nr:MAG: RNA polymerase sigma factor [Planctomycetota bacterium]
MVSPALRLVHHRSGPAPLPGSDAFRAARDPREQLSDEELLAVTCGGDLDAFRLLVERYEEKAMHTARSMVGSPETAREVVQDTFLKVYAHRQRFDLHRKFSSWFYRILRNQAVDRMRRQSSGTPGAAAELIGDWNAHASGPASAVSSLERRDAVRRVLSDLPAKFRAVLVMRDLEGLSCGDIAQRVGTTPGTVRWRLHHARKLFRDHWERLLGCEEGGGEL